MCNFIYKIAYKHRVCVITRISFDRYNGRYPRVGLRGGYSRLVQGREHKFRGGAGGRGRYCGGNGDVKIARRSDGRE